MKIIPALKRGSLGIVTALKRGDYVNKRFPAGKRDVSKTRQLFMQN